MSENYTYAIIKMTARKIFNAKFELTLSNSQIENLLINEPDNGYFGIIRNLANKPEYFKNTTKNPAFMSEIVFVDCSYDNKIYTDDDLKWAKEKDIENKKKLESIKASLERKIEKRVSNESEIETINLKLEKVNSSLSDFKSIYASYKKKNEDVKTYEKNLDTLLRNGFSILGNYYSLLGMSGAMARNGIKAFVCTDLYDDVIEYSYLIDKPDKCKIPKYEAYRNLLFTSCRAYVDKLPRICVVPDYSMIIPNVAIKYPADGFYVTYEQDRKTIKSEIPRKVMKSGVKDIEINCFDGASIHSVEYNKVLYNSLPNSKEDAVLIPQSYQLRLPFLKGLSTCFDFKGFCKEKGVEKIKDIDGEFHNVDDIDIIVTKSMYKGADIFKSFNEYYDAVKNKGFRLGISNCNKTSAECSPYTNANYQYLQNISALTKDDLIELSKYFTNSIDKVIADPCEVFKLFSNDDNSEEETDSDNKVNYNKNLPETLQALQICPEMAKDEGVRASISKLIKNSIKRAKYGRIPLLGGYKYLVPDLFMLMCWVGKNSGYDIEIKPVLKAGEMYCSGKNGKHSVFRSPQLLENEINVIELVENELTEKWFKHLDNILIVNSCSIDMMRMQTADFDGDNGFLCEEKLITDKVRTGLPLVVNINETKPPVLDYNEDNIVEYHKKTLDCLIGQITNKSCSLHNKINKTATTNQLKLDKVIDDTRIKVLEDLEYLSIQIQLETDYVKAGIRWETPYDIERNSAELPYFMQYRYDKLRDEFKRINNKRNNAKNRILKNANIKIKDKYVKDNIDDVTKQKIKNKLSEARYKLPVNCSKTPLNELCHYLEKWNPTIKFRLKSENVSELFTPDRIIDNKIVMDKVKIIYDRYLSDSYEQVKSNKQVNWNAFYRSYKKLFLEVCQNEKALLYYLIQVCYNSDEDKKKINKNIVWNLCGQTIINILLERKNKQKNDSDNKKSDAVNTAIA